MKLKKRYLIAPLAAILLTSPMNHAKNNSAKASYLENIVENFSSFITSKPTEIPEVTIYGKKSTFDKRIFQIKMQEQSSDEIPTPYFRLKKDRCSQYSRLAAKKLFGKEYNSGHAWNLRYSNKVVHEIQKQESIKDLIIRDKLEPGMLIGVYQPRSSYKNRKDEKGQKVKYTHVITYLGLNNQGKPEFVNQLGRRIQRITDEDFSKKKFTPKEIIDSYN